MFTESRQQQARRWAKFPATVLFALSVLWLVRSFFAYMGSGAGFQDYTHTGLGILRIVADLLIIPVGGAVVGLYLLLRKRWAVMAAAVLPLEPLLIDSAQKLAKVHAKFHEYNVSGDLSKLNTGLMDLLVVVAFAAAYLLMLVHLYKVWNHLREGRAAPWSALAPNQPLESTVDKSRRDNGNEDVCFLLPETEDVESA